MDVPDELAAAREMLIELITQCTDLSVLDIIYKLISVIT